jgi:hypothetical protein
MCLGKIFSFYGTFHRSYVENGVEKSRVAQSNVFAERDPHRSEKEKILERKGKREILERTIQHSGWIEIS